MGLGTIMIGAYMALTDPAGISQHVMRRLRERGRARSEGWVLNAQIEQEPSPDNRVRLSPRATAFLSVPQLH